MHRSFICVLVAGSVLVSASIALAQVSPANEGKTAEQVHKNIKPVMTMVGGRVVYEATK